MWDIGKIILPKLQTLKGLINLQSGAPKPEENPTLNVQFQIQQLVVSGKMNVHNTAGKNGCDDRMNHLII